MNIRKISILFVILLCSIAVLTQGVSAQTQGDDLSLRLKLPNEGETFYSGPSSLMYVIPIIGYVQSESFTPEQITVDIGIYQDDIRVTGQTVKPKESGEFRLYGRVNRGENTQDYTADFASCADNCHINSAFNFQDGKWQGAIINLPNGPVTVRVTASDPDGRIISALRNFIVDNSDYASVPVQLEFPGDSHPSLENIPVTGSAWMYMWRARYATRETDANGLVIMKVETLSQASTTYRFQVLPVVVNGIHYESIAPVEIVLAPGTTEGPPITLQMRTKLGAIQGQIEGKINLTQLEILAIRVKDGDVRTTQLSPDGSFAFDDLPISEYLITIDPDLLAKQGYRMAGEIINLEKTTSPGVDFQPVELEGSFCQGTIMDTEGHGLPFAWVKIENMDPFVGVLPDSGKFVFPGFPSEKAVLVANAPGFYSQAHIIELDTEGCENLEYRLVRHPDTRSLSWGDGEIVIPAETQISISGQNYFLERGWLWGQNQTDAPITIQRGSMEIQLSSGKFAIEDVPGKPGWLYLFEGSGIIKIDNGSTILPIEAGEMVALDEVKQPNSVPYNKVVVKTLNADDLVPVPTVIEPTLMAQFTNRLALIGIDAAVVITYVTYGLVLASVIILPLIVVIGRRRKDNKQF